DSPQDPVSAASKSTFVVDAITPTDNNVTHRNYLNLSTMSDQDFVKRFFVRNPTSKPIQVRLSQTAPRRWRVSLDKLRFDKAVSMKPGEEVLVEMAISAPERGQKGLVSIIQQEVEGGKTQIMGGLTLQFEPVALPVPTVSNALISPYLIGTWDLRQSRTLL